MLHQHFFVIDRWVENEQAGEFFFRINSRHEVFSGHFPGHPVVPGVFTLQIIKECLEMIVRKKMQYTEIRNCKFSNAIVPDDERLFCLEYEYVPGEAVDLKAVVKSENIVYLSLKACLKEQESTSE